MLVDITPSFFTIFLSNNLTGLFFTVSWATLQYCTGWLSEDDNAAVVAVLPKAVYKVGLLPIGCIPLNNNQIPIVA